MLRKSVGKIIKEGKEEDVENELEKVSKTCPETHDSMPRMVLGPGSLLFDAGTIDYRLD